MRDINRVHTSLLSLNSSLHQQLWAFPECVHITWKAIVKDYFRQICSDGVWTLHKQVQPSSRHGVDIGKRFRLILFRRCVFDWVIFTGLPCVGNSKPLFVNNRLLDKILNCTVNDLYIFKQAPWSQVVLFCFVLFCFFVHCFLKSSLTLAMKCFCFCFCLCFCQRIFLNWFYSNQSGES